MLMKYFYEQALKNFYIDSEVFDSAFRIDFK